MVDADGSGLVTGAELKAFMKKHSLAQKKGDASDDEESDHDHSDEESDGEKDGKKGGKKGKKGGKKGKGKKGDSDDEGDDSEPEEALVQKKGGKGPSAKDIIDECDTDQSGGLTIDEAHACIDAHVSDEEKNA